MTALIQTIGLSKTYTAGKNIQTPALANINLTIDAGDFMAVAGPSGSGKSSLLHLLGALDNANSGSIIYEGRDITQLNNEQRAQFRLKHIGFVFQAYNLINTLNALENVEYIMLLQGIGNDERKDRAVDMLIRVGLGDYIYRFPNEMSGGQQQRVAVARAIAAKPKIILADEPTANLDSKTASSLMDLMRQLNEENKITFIFSTHDQLVMSKVKKIVTLKDGEIVK